MMNPWRPLVLAAALNAMAGLDEAAAQTVIVRKAPPGAAIGLVLNAAAIGSTTADADGDASLPVDLAKHGGKAEIDAHIYVDACGTMRRVLLVERGVDPAPPEGGCARREVAGVFWVQGVTTLVVDVGGAEPTLRLRQGPAPAEWLRKGPEPESAARVWRPAPVGPVLFGGGGFASFRDALFVTCGDAAECTGDGSPLAYTAGATFWFNRFLAAEAAYLKPLDVIAKGSGDRFRFDSVLETRLLTVAGKVGFPIGPVRIYGQAGANYHEATSSTTQTIDDRAVTVADVPRTLRGGTQTFELKTAGWGWLFGGGAEAWVTRSFALYAEIGQAAIKGTATDDAEGAIDERLTFILIGARVRLGR